MRIRKFTILAIVSLLVATVCMSGVSTPAASNPPQTNPLIPRNVQVWTYTELGQGDLVDMSSDGKYVVAGDNEFMEVCLLDETGNTLWKFALPPQLAVPRIHWLHISDDGKYVAFGGDYIDETTGEHRGFVFFFDRQGHVWNKTDFADGVWTGSISGDGSRVAIGHGSRVEVYDKAGVLRWKYDFDPYSVWSVSISSEGDYVAVGYDAGVSLLYGGFLVWEQRTGAIDPVRISADGKYVIAIDWHAHNVLYYDQTGTLLWSQTIGASHWPWPHDASISSNGEFAVAVDNTTIHFFDKTGLRWSHNTGEEGLTSVDMSSDGNFIVAFSPYGEKVWHFNKHGTLIWEISLPPGWTGDVAISGNGEYFAATAGVFPGNIYLYFSKKYFNYRFVTPDAEPISNLDVRWYFADGTLRTSILTDDAGWIEFFDPYFVDYYVDAYYRQTKVGSYVLVKTTRYKLANTHVASLFDWDIYIECLGGFPLPARVETYLWDNTLYDNRTTAHLRFENMPTQTYTVKVYYPGLPVIEREVTLIEDEQVLTITIPVTTLTVTVDPPENGRVILYPEPDAEGKHLAGTVVTLTAEPAEGWEFERWSGDVAGTKPTITLTMDAPKSVTAHFAVVVPRYILTVTIDPPASGTVTLNPLQPVEGYKAATVVTLTAVPADGFRFDRWSGDVAGTKPTITLTMDAPKSVTAHFAKEVVADVIPPEVISVSPEDAATDVVVGTSISVTFDQAMDKAAAEGAFSIDPEIPGTFNWVDETLTFNPDADLAYGTTYTITIATAARDLAGNALAAPYTWSFTTEPEPVSLWWVWIIIGMLTAGVLIYFLVIRRSGRRSFRSSSRRIARKRH